MTTATVNVISMVMRDSKQPTPVIGMGATILHWSDREPATVTYVSPSGKTIRLREDRATRIDRNGMSDAQQYTYEPDPYGYEFTARLTKRGWTSKGTPIALGHRSKFHDFSF